MTSALGAAVVGVGFAAVLVWLQLRDRRRVVSAREAMFDGCTQVIDGATVARRGLGMPELRGRYRGRDVVLSLWADHLAPRKLPALWLLVTVSAELPDHGILDFLVRPHNLEPFSPAADLPFAIDIPPGWPVHATLRTDDPERLPPPDVVGPHLRDFFSRPEAKELLVTPRGVRLVRLLEEGSRAHYIAGRQVVFRGGAVPPSLCAEMCERAHDLVEELSSDEIAAAPAA